jgi:hypothetical protein
MFEKTTKKIQVFYVLFEALHYYFMFLCLRMTYITILALINQQIQSNCMNLMVK